MQFETREELEAWLNEQPRETCLLIAARAVLRVFPLITHDDEGPQGYILVAARAILTTGVATKFPTPEVKSAAARACSASYDAASAYDDAIEDAAWIAKKNKDSYATPDALNAASNAIDAVTRAIDAVGAKANKNAHHNVADFCAYAILGGVGSDFERANLGVDTELDFSTLLTAPLRHAPGEPRWLIERVAGKENLLNSGPEWAFWRAWYQGFLDGKPMDWELQRRVALIEDEIWKAGPEAVAEEIERIRAEFLAEKIPQTERVEFNPETGKFFTTPIEIAKPDLFGRDTHAG